MTLTVGSTFSGYDGIGLALRGLLGAEPIWFSEIEPAAVKVLAHHWPTVPNLGDITAIDWATVQRPDIITGGFPCQDVSLAGQRAGAGHGTRTGLYRHLIEAIDTLRPSLVVMENVRGLLSAKVHADPDLGSDTAAVGLRALGVVLADLALIGFDACWTGLRASDVGAAHQRFRIFILAWPAAADPGSKERISGAGLCEAGSGRVGWSRSGDSGSPAADPDSIELRIEPVGLAERGDPSVTRRTGQAAADPVGSGFNGRSCDPRWGQVGRTAPTGDSGVDLTVADPASDGRDERRTESTGLVRRSDAAERSGVDWGKYRPAIDRQVGMMGRAEPFPTIVGARGGRKLSPHFDEWLMGLPEGHVNIPGVTVNEALKLCGNGVVPQQAEAAISHLLQVRTAALMAQAR